MTRSMKVGWGNGRFLLVVAVHVTFGKHQAIVHNDTNAYRRCVPILESFLHIAVEVPKLPG